MCHLCRCSRARWWAAGGRVSGAGAYLTGHVRLRDVVQRAGVFRAKGGGQMIAIFGALPSVWFTVGMMRERLACMQVAVSSSTVRDAFEQLEKMGFLEKMVRPDAPQNAPMRYRRKLTDAQREHIERLRARGYHAVCCVGFDEARVAIERYLGLAGRVYLNGSH